MILTKEVEARPRGSMIQYYRDKGYEANYNELIIVNVEDLPNRSNVKVSVKCDYCGKETQMAYADYIRLVERYGDYACKKCGEIHSKKTCLKKYGCEYAFQAPEVKEKNTKTLIKHYGVDNPLKCESIKRKVMNTNIERYGVPHVLQNEEIRGRAVNTLMERYGVSNPFHYSDFKEKSKQTCQERYGVYYYLKSPEVREKIAQSYYSASSQKCSKQQLHIYNLYNTTGKAELNYPISYHNADICFPDEKLVVEYDGGGHRLKVTLGQLTEDEFNQKEFVRDKIIKRSGFNLIRIISADDKLPSDNILLQMLEQTKEYFATYPEHSWVEFDLDTSTVRNAEHKDGVYFYYGDLHKL